jgi:hypothetical protein
VVGVRRIYGIWSWARCGRSIDGLGSREMVTIDMAPSKRPAYPTPGTYPMQLQFIDHVVIIVSDPSRTERFYANFLGR